METGCGDGNREYYVGSNYGTGASSLMDKGTLTPGLGAGRGAGGWYKDGLHAKGRHISGVGGCLYILSTNVYSVCTINLPNEFRDANIEINVENDSLSVDNYSIFTPANVGTISGTGSKSFIVKKDSTIKYNVVSTDGNYIAQGTITNAGTSETNIGTYDYGTNTHTVQITLKKKILTHTIITNDANINITGKFTDENGNVIKNSDSTTGEITFKVWSGEPNVTWTVSRTYYDGQSGSITITESGPKQTVVTLEKHKYYANLSQTGKIEFNNGERSVTASWNNWSIDEKNKAVGTQWDIIIEGFEGPGWPNSDTSINWNNTVYSNNLPSSRTVIFKNYYHTGTGIFTVYWNKTFTIGTVYAILKN